MFGPLRPYWPLPLLFLLAFVLPLPSAAPPAEKGPTYDLLFETVQNSTVAGPDPSGGTTCALPPVINFTGTATRCIMAP